MRKLKVQINKKLGFDALIEAFTIFRKYDNPSHHTHCEHDVMLVCVDSKKVSEEDKERLEELGFFVGSEWPGYFTSFKFGSA